MFVIQLCLLYYLVKYHIGERLFQCIYYLDEINPQQLGPSILYIWDTNLREFRFYQWFTTHDALDVTFFKIALNPSLTYSCLVIANAYDGKTSHVTSEIFCLSRSYFVSRQMIPVKTNFVVHFFCCRNVFLSIFS